MRVQIALIAALTLACGSLILGLAGLLGVLAPWLDVLNTAAPLWLLLAVASLAISLTTGRDAGLRRLSLGIGAAGLLVCAVRVVPEGAAARLSPWPLSGARAGVRVFQQNAWDSNPDRGRLVKTLVASKADVVALEEAQGDWGPAGKALAASYPYRAPCPSDRWCELILASRRPITAYAWLRRSRAEEASESSPLAVYIRTTGADGRPVSVVATHLRWPFPPPAQRLESARVASFLEILPDRSRLILVGDFNSTPWAWASGARDALFRPLVRRTHGQATWPATLNKGKSAWLLPVLPIDQVYASPDWRRVWVRKAPWAASDHYGLITDAD